MTSGRTDGVVELIVYPGEAMSKNPFEGLIQAPGVYLGTTVYLIQNDVVTTTCPIGVPHLVPHQCIVYPHSYDKECR